MSKLEQLLKDFEIESPEVINAITLYETLNKVADKWEDMQKSQEELEQVSFKAKCTNPTICCNECKDYCEGRRCSNNCHTYKFDCKDCYKKEFRL